MTESLLNADGGLRPAEIAVSEGDGRWPVSLDIEAIASLDRPKCIARWIRQFGQEPPRYVSVQFMRRVLAHEAQVKVHGGHSAAVRKVLKAALKGGGKHGGKAEPGTTPTPAVLRPGTHLVREWNGRTYQIEVREDGFQVDGKRYRSLSAIARKITGAHWSGPRFFGLG